MPSYSVIEKCRHGRIALTNDLSPAGGWRRLGARLTVLTLLLISSTSMPVAAQSPGAEFCNTQMAETIQNMFTVIQFGGPLIGGLIALGATLAIPMTRRADRKKELKALSYQALIYGVLVAPLGTAIISFLLNNVVVGGASCGF